MGWLEDEDTSEGPPKLRRKSTILDNSEWQMDPRAVQSTYTVRKSTKVITWGF